MQIKEIMTRNVESVDSDSPIAEAARKMKSLDVGFIPVIDGNGPVGVVTDRDIVIRAVAENRDTSQTTVGEIMSETVETISEDEDVGDAAKLMEERQIRRLLVTGGNDRIVGVVSLGDLAVKTHDGGLCGEVLEEVSEPASPQR